MTASPKLNEEEIIAYYEDCEVDYRLLWHLDTHLCMHYGYWEKDTRRLRDALVLMNEKMASYADIQPGEEVLDAGCGVGGSSIFLAGTHGCQVHGITLSGKQVDRCRENACKHGVDELVNFSRQNYLHTEFPDESFDVVWGLESICYAEDKADFLREAYRLLRPGGRLVVGDFFSTPMEPDSSEAALMAKWTATWAIGSYAETGVFVSKAGHEGFTGVMVNDITDRVVPSIRRLYYTFFPGLICTKVLQWLGLRNKRQTANTWSTWYQYRAWKRGLWKYNIITAVKPAASSAFGNVNLHQK